MSDRKKLSDLQGAVDGLSEGGLALEVQDGSMGRYMLLKHANGEILCGFKLDDMFDADGMRFEDDAD